MQPHGSNIFLRGGRDLSLPAEIRIYIYSKSMDKCGHIQRKSYAKLREALLRITSLYINASCKLPYLMKIDENLL